MSTSLLYHAFGVDGVKYKSAEYTVGNVYFLADVVTKSLSCPQCNHDHFQSKGLKERIFRMVPIGQKACFLKLTVPRLKCQKCKHLWWAKLPFMAGKRRATRGFIRYAIELLNFSTIKDVAKMLQVGWDMIKEIHKTHLKRLYKQKFPYGKLRYIGVDEFSIQKGHTYMTIFVDLERGRIIHAVKGRALHVIKPFLKRLAKKAHKLRAIAMDMSAGYNSAISEILPHVDIVFDHFHVTALINAALDEVRRHQQNLWETINEMKTIKGKRFLLLKNYENLDSRKQQTLRALLQINQPLLLGHAMKEQFRLFWTKKRKRDAARFLLLWIMDAIETGLPPLQRVARTFLKYFEKLLNYFTHHLSNARTEGINNKIKTMKRQAYGYRDEEYFTLRLYHLHERGYSFPG